MSKTTLSAIKIEGVVVDDISAVGVVFVTGRAGARARERIGTAPSTEVEASVVAEGARTETGPVEATGLVGSAGVDAVARAPEGRSIKPSLVDISISSMRVWWRGRTVAETT